MNYIFKFPDIGEGITEGKILQWYVKKGQMVKAGEALVKMETDKVVTDIPSPKDGRIIALFGKEGEVINVEDALVELELEGVSGIEAQATAKEKPEPAGQETVEEKGFGVVGAIENAGNAAFLPAGTEGRGSAEADAQQLRAKKALATPTARAMAKDLGVDINMVIGTGPAGRVMKNDIKAYYEKQQSGTTSPGAAKTVPTGSAANRFGMPGDAEQPRVVYEPLSQIRKTIARNMVRSKQTLAHMTVMDDVEVSELVALRNKYKDQYLERGAKLSFLPFIIKALVQTLKEFPSLNSELQLEEDRMVLKNYYNIGIAVDTPDGLVVPVIRNADRLSLFQLALEIDNLAKRARDRQLSLEDFKDGTFTVTNYGSIGGTYGVPVINYPQSAILGLGRILKTPVVKNDQIVVGHVLPVSMSVDHRIVDGADAARFMARFLGFMADPVSLLLV